jgi:hypothetical protein
MSNPTQRHRFSRIGGHGDSMYQDAGQDVERQGDPATGDRHGEPQGWPSCPAGVVRRDEGVPMA